MLDFGTVLQCTSTFSDLSLCKCDVVWLTLENGKVWCSIACHWLCKCNCNVMLFDWHWVEGGPMSSGLVTRTKCIQIQISKESQISPFDQSNIKIILHQTIALCVKGGPRIKRSKKMAKLNLRFSSKKITNLYLLRFLTCLSYVPYLPQNLNDFSAEIWPKLQQM